VVAWVAFKVMVMVMRPSSGDFFFSGATLLLLLLEDREEVGDWEDGGVVGGGASLSILAISIGITPASCLDDLRSLK
jgi:hypothetical protein